MKQINKYRILSTANLTASLVLGLVAVPKSEHSGWLLLVISLALLTTIMFMMFTVWAASVYRDHNGDECSIELDRYAGCYGLKRKWFGLEPDHRLEFRIIAAERQFLE